MMNPTKFGSLYLDTPSSRYEFLKHAFKSMKTNKKSITTQTDRWGPLVSRTLVSTIPEQRRCSSQHYLTGSEITGDDSDTNMFSVISRTQWYPLMDRWCTGAPSLVVMVAWWSYAVVRWPSPTMVCVSEDG